MTWQPIETAPKNCQYIIMCGGGLLPDIVVWHPEEAERMVNGNRVLARPAGWFNVSRSRILNPTHWMPIPDLPPDGSSSKIQKSRDSQARPIND